MDGGSGKLGVGEYRTNTNDETGVEVYLGSGSNGTKTYLELDYYDGYPCIKHSNRYPYTAKKRNQPQGKKDI